MTTTIVYQRQYFGDLNGKPLDSGSLYLGVANQDPQTHPIVAYWDSALTQVAAQPISISAGYTTHNGSRAPVYVAEETYSSRVLNRAGVLVDYVADASDAALNNKAAKDLSNVPSFRDAVASFEGGNPGLIIKPFTFYNDAPTTGDVADITILRREPSGGASGFTSNALRVIMQTVAGSLNFAWGALFKLDNYANAGENNAAYFQGIKRSTGATWSCTTESIDATGSADPTTGLIGGEIDIRANGTDTNNQRIALDIVATRQLSSQVPTGAAMEAGAGIRLQNGGDASATFNYGIWFYPGTKVKIGIDFSTATIVGQAIKMMAGQTIGWGNSPDVQSFYDATAVGLVDQVSSTTIHARYNNGLTYKKPVSYASLPTAGLFGREAFVSDLTSTTRGSVAAGGGTNKGKVWDDGAVWLIA